MKKMVDLLNEILSEYYTSFGHEKSPPQRSFRHTNKTDKQSARPGQKPERALCFVHRGCNWQQRLKQNKAA